MAENFRGGEIGGTSPESIVGPQPTSEAHRRITWLIVFAALSYLLDQSSKALAVAKLSYGSRVWLIPGWLDLSLTRNPGAAFGMGAGYTAVFTVMAVAVVATVIRYASKLSSRWWAVALGLVLGGALGNLSDRLFRFPGAFRGMVVDFIHPNHFAVFNMADTAICCGGFMVVVLSFMDDDPGESAENP